MKNLINITDWTGKVLYSGKVTSKQVDAVLDANRCEDCTEETREDCDECNGTGYSGDFEVNWADENDVRNVYEFINY